MPAAVSIARLAAPEGFSHAPLVGIVGAAFAVLASALLYAGHPVSPSLGIGPCSAAASIFPVCASPCVMDYIAKREHVRSESIRIRHVAPSWLVAPSLGP